MQVKVKNEAGFQILTSAMSIGPSQTGYVLEVSADGKNFSPLFAVAANTTKMATGLAPNAYYRLKGNVGEVIVNWSRSCVTEGGGSGTELAPVSEFPLGVADGTVVAYSGSSSAAGIYMYDGTDWVSAGGSTDLSDYWNSGETKDYVDEAISGISLEGYATSGDMQSAFTLISETQQVAAAGLNQLEERIDELSAATPSTEEIELPIAAAVNDLKSNIEARLDQQYYKKQEVNNIAARKVEAGQVAEQIKDYVDPAITEINDNIEDKELPVSAALNDLNQKISEISGGSGGDMSAYWTSAQTEEAISAATAGKADAANITANTGNYIFPKWNSQGIISGTSQQVFKSYLLVNDEGTGAYFFMNSSKYETQNKALKLYTPLSAGTAGDILVSTGNGAPVWSAVTMGGNSPIIPAITTQAEYGAISGDVKSGDLIQVQEVDINDDGEDESGLFEATVQEEEDGPGGDIIRIVYWERKDNADSIFWNNKDYPWMAENDVWPVDFGEGHFLISTDDTSEDEAYNGIGFDDKGKPVIAHIVPQYDEETGEITGMTRTDANIVKSTSVSTIWKGTQAEYDAITTKDPNTFYIIVNN